MQLAKFTNSNPGPCYGPNGLTFKFHMYHCITHRIVTRQVTLLSSDLLERFLPVTLVRSLHDMTCTVKNSESDSGPPSSCTYYRCDNCPQAFCSEEEYVQHTRTHHTQAPPAEENKRPSRSSTLSCRSCKYTAPDGNKAALHEKLHRDQKSGVSVYKCKPCHFLSCSKMGITIHKRLEHAPIKYECPMCNYSSFNARHVTAHVDKVHCNPVQELWNCPYCSAQLDTGSSYNRAWNILRLLDLIDLLYTSVFHIV